MRIWSVTEVERAPEMRALITGGGFVAQWLARALIARGDAVFVAGLAEGTALPMLSTAEHERIQRIVADFRHPADVSRAVEASRPDLVFHLAGISFPPQADAAPDITRDVNVQGAVRLLDAISAQRLDPMVVIVGSGTQYGRHEASEMPLDESAEQRPRGMYAVSKAEQEAIALERAARDGLRVACTRSFNHSGLGHARQFLLPTLVERVRGIQSGAAPVLKLGNDSVRDYLHVDDVVTAYLSIAERGRVGETYNVASGKGVSVRQLASDVLLRAGVSADISTEPALVRASDIPVLIGSPAKLSRDTGWTPAKTHADIIDDLLRPNAATD
jgi:GDP-4-dehydro-6-deoxy-D-mannose reductase